MFNADSPRTQNGFLWPHIVCIGCIGSCFDTAIDPWRSDGCKPFVSQDSSGRHRSQRVGTPIVTQCQNLFARQLRVHQLHSAMVQLAATNAECCDRAGERKRCGEHCEHSVSYYLQSVTVLISFRSSSQTRRTSLSSHTTATTARSLHWVAWTMVSRSIFLSSTPLTSTRTRILQLLVEALIPRS